MKFQVHGELDIPVEVTELLTGMCLRPNANDFDDIVMSLNQKSLDRLSVILNLLYATQSLKDVEHSMLRITSGNSVDQPHSAVTNTSYVSPPPQNKIQPAITEFHNSVQHSHNVIDVTALGLNEQKLSKDISVKSIAALSRNMKGRVG